MKLKHSLWIGALALLVPIGAATAQPYAIGTAFTYQGEIEQAGSRVGTPTPVDCYFQFSLWDAPGSGQPPTGGTQHGPTLSMTTTVIDGLFTVELDFGSEFNGDARWLEMAVCCPSTCDVVTLSPRQELTPTPHAIRARSGVGGPNGLNVDTDDLVGIGTTTVDTGVKLQVAGGDVKTDGQLVSTVATGTPPLVVSSTTKVSNLNADMLDGQHGCQWVRNTGYVETGDFETTDVAALYGSYPKGCIIRLISTSSDSDQADADDGEALGLYNQNWWDTNTGGWSVVAISSDSTSVYSTFARNGDGTPTVILTAGSCTLVDDTAAFNSNTTWVIQDSSTTYSCYLYVCD